MRYTLLAVLACVAVATASPVYDKDSVDIGGSLITKQVAGKVKLELAAYRELAAFAQFGSDLDAATLAVLDKGAKNVQILKQGQYTPMPVEKQVAIIFCGVRGLLTEVPLDKIQEFEKEYLDFLELKHKKVLDTIKSGKIDDEVEQVLIGVAKEVAERF